MPDTKPGLTFPSSAEEKNYDAWVNNLQNIRPDPFLSDDEENLDPQTQIFVDNKYQTLVDYLPNIEPDVKTYVFLEDISDTDKIDYTSDIEFVKKTPSRDRLKLS